MRRPALYEVTFRNLLFTLFVFLGLSAHATAQDNQTQLKRDSSQAPVAQSIVKGRAVYEDTGQPAQRERIQLVAPELLTAHRGRIPTAITDENGEFSFRGIGAGEYYIVARPIDEHVGSAVAAPFPLQTGDPVRDAAMVSEYKKENIEITVDGVNTIRIDLRVRNPHFGTISGRIVNDDGKPAVGSQVNLTPRTGSVETNTGAYTLTDEEGSYRFKGLAAGEYTVSANPPSKLPDRGKPRNWLEGSLGATYFPSTVDAGSSPAINVYPDRETSDINITLAPRKLHSVAGNVRMMGDGRPISGAAVRLFKKDEPVQGKSVAVTEAITSNYFSTTDKEGRWSVHNLPDGSYFVHITLKLNVPGRDTNVKFVEKGKEVTVAGSDLEDVLIEVSSGASISGTIIVEGNQPIFSLFLRALKSGESFESSQTANLSLRPAEKVTTFVLTQVPEGVVQFGATVQPDSFYIKSITANGVDLLRENLTVPEGAEVKDVRIVVSPDVAKLSGRVVSANGETGLSGVGIMLIRIPADKRWALASQLSGVTDSEGNFSLRPPPGEYIIELRRISHDPPSISKPLLENSPRVTLQPGELKSIEIRIP